MKNCFLVMFLTPRSSTFSRYSKILFPKYSKHPRNREQRLEILFMDKKCLLVSVEFSCKLQWVWYVNNWAELSLAVLSCCCLSCVCCVTASLSDICPCRKVGYRTVESSWKSLLCNKTRLLLAEASLCLTLAARLLPLHWADSIW